MIGMHQMLFVLAAMTLLSQITVTVNRYILSNLQSSLTSEATITATGLAQSMLLEVSTKAFDEKTVTQSVASPDSLTSLGSLGADGGEADPNFDDVDDFHLLQRTVNTPRLGTFRVRTQVWYVAGSNLDVPSATRTYMKRVTVTIDQNTSLEYPVIHSRVLSY